MRISDWSSDVCSSDLMRFMTNMYLPRISARQANPPAWDRADHSLSSQTISLAIEMQFVYVLIAPFAVQLQYCPHFGIALPAVSLFSLFPTHPVTRFSPAPGASGAGRRHTSLANNHVR